MRKLIATIILMIDSFHHQQINPYVIQHLNYVRQQLNTRMWDPGFSSSESAPFSQENQLFFLLFIISMCLFVCLFPCNITGPTSRIQQFHDVTKFMEEYNILLVVNIYIFYK